MEPTIASALDSHFSIWPDASGEPVGEAEIAAAEASLGMSFPAEYREFVARYGGGVVGDTDIVGLRAAPFMGEGSPGVVEETLRWRRQMPQLADWLVIAVDGGGNPIGFSPRGPAVLVFDHDFGGLIELAPSFNVFVRELLARM